MSFCGNIKKSPVLQGRHRLSFTVNRNRFQSTIVDQRSSVFVYRSAIFDRRSTVIDLWYLCNDLCGNINYFLFGFITTLLSLPSPKDSVSISDDLTPPYPNLFCTKPSKLKDHFLRSCHAFRLNNYCYQFTSQR